MRFYSFWGIGFSKLWKQERRVLPKPTRTIHLQIMYSQYFHQLESHKETSEKVPHWSKKRRAAVSLLLIKKKQIFFLPWLSNVLVETQNEEDDAQYRFWMLDSFTHPPVPGDWRPTWMGLEKPEGDPFSSPISSQAGSCTPPLFFFPERSRKRRENEKILPIYAIM